MHNTRVYGNDCGGMDFINGAEKLNVAHYAKALGYTTFYAGKYLNNYGNANVGGLSRWYAQCRAACSVQRAACELDGCLSTRCSVFYASMRTPCSHKHSLCPPLPLANDNNNNRCALLRC